jgi:ATP-dependent Clp protease ATP-binding subunit ClpC
MFTDRVRIVMQKARDEAARLNHEYVGTEHLLLGLISEGRGVAVQVLELAMNEAHKLGHSTVGTEHLLVGVLREEKGIAAQVLTHHAGVTLENARSETARLSTRSNE